MDKSGVDVQIPSASAPESATASAAQATGEIPQTEIEVSSPMKKDNISPTLKSERNTLLEVPKQNGKSEAIKFEPAREKD